MAVRPEVFVLGSRAHGRAALSGTEFHEDAVQDIDFIVEFDGVNCKPLVEVFSSWEFDGQLHVTTSDGHSCDLLELVASSALADLALLLK